MRLLQQTGFVCLMVFTTAMGMSCGDSDDAPARQQQRQLNAGLPGNWVRTTPCPLESSPFCAFYQEGLEIDSQLIRGTVYLGAQNATLATATYRILNENEIEVREVTTDATRTARVTVDDTNLRACDVSAPENCVDFRRVATLPPKLAGGHALPRVAKAVYELSIDGATTTVELTGSAATAIFPANYSVIVPSVRSQPLVQPTPGDLHYANIEAVLVGPDPENVGDYRFHVEVYRTGADANILLARTTGTVALVPGTALELTGSEGGRAYRFRMNIVP